MPEPRCHRCGDTVRPGQTKCTACGAGLSFSAIRDDYALGAEIGPSSVFTLPVEMPVSSALERRGAHEHQQLLIWIAVGLALVSIISGILYHLYYMRTGNSVTSLLPRETVAYVRVSSPDALEEAFHNLDLWQSSRPVRENVHVYERRMVSSILLDVGVNNALLQEFKEQVLVMHLALLPRAALRARFPFDVVVFLEFEDHFVRDNFMDRIAPYFTRYGQGSGDEFFLKKVGSSAYSMSAFERSLVVSWGDERVMAEVLQRRDEGPSRSLNDDDGFRAAFEVGGRTADFWSYFRANAFPALALRQLHLMTKKSGISAWVDRISRFFSSGDVTGVGFAAYPSNGNDHGRMRVHSTRGPVLKQLSRQLGVRTKKSLSVIPSDAVFAAITTVDDPSELFETWGQDIMRLLGEVNITQITDLSMSALNRFQAESGILFSRELWPNLSREVGVALLRREADDSLGWLWVVYVQNAERAIRTLDKLFANIFVNAGGKFRRERYEFSSDDELNQVHRIIEKKSASGQWAQVEKLSSLCWSMVGRHIVLADDCDLVHRAKHADAWDETLEDDESLALTLEALPQENTALVVARLPWLFEHYAEQWSINKWVHSDFMFAAALTLQPDGIEVTSNLSLLPASFIAAYEKLEPANVADVDEPCRRLEASVCDSLASTHLCELWRADLVGSHAQACRTALRTMEWLKADVTN